MAMQQVWWVAKVSACSSWAAKSTEQPVAQSRGQRHPQPPWRAPQITSQRSMG
jgi:hypothetical protein